MDAFTLTDYLLSAILGVLMFMVIIKASDRFFPVILVWFSLLPFLPAADEQDIVDAVNAANSAITGGVNAVESELYNIESEVYTVSSVLYIIDSTLSSIDTTLSSSGSSLGNIEYYTSYNNGYLGNIDTNTSNIASDTASYLGNIESYTNSTYYSVNSLDSLMQTATAAAQSSLDNLETYLYDISNQTYETADNTALTASKIDDLELAVGFVTSAIEACCYEEMAALDVLDQNTDNIEALLEAIDESIDDFAAQEYLANSHRDELMDDMLLELQEINIDTDHLEGIHDDTSELVTLSTTANSTLASMLSALSTVESNTDPEYEGGDLEYDPLDGIALHADDPLTFDEAGLEGDIEGEFASDIQDVVSPDGTDVGLLKTALGMDQIIDDLGTLSIPSSEADLSTLNVATIDWSGDANLGSFDFGDAAESYWDIMQPLVLLLVTGFIAYRMLLFTLIHTQKALAA